MTKRLAIIQGHPDARGSHCCHSLADTYAAGARGAGHEVLIGMVDSRGTESRGKWLIRVQALGRKAS